VNHASCAVAGEDAGNIRGCSQAGYRA
jgi:hypothetical protein